MIAEGKIGEWAEALRQARWSITEESEARFYELLEEAVGTEDPFVLSALISTFRDDSMDDGGDEAIYNILLDAPPELWIAAMLQDLPRLSAEALDTCGCLLEFSTRTPQVLVDLLGAQSEETQNLVMGLLDRIALRHQERGIDSEISSTLQNLRAATGEEKRREAERREAGQPELVLFEREGSWTGKS